MTDLKELLTDSPCYRIDHAEGNEIYIKREDMIPYSFGGNKVVIAQKLCEDMYDKGCDCLIAYGNPQSNMCRILSTYCAMKNIPCHIVSPTKDDKNKEGLNRQISYLMGAKVRYCDRENVSQTLDALISELKDKGLRPYYIYGDIYGNGNERIASSAYEERYMKFISGDVRRFDIDLIVLPLGTGMTMGGIISGRNRCGDSVKVVGISVARDKKTAAGYLDKYCGYDEENGFLQGFSCEDEIVDEYICGGYGLYDTAISSTIDSALRLYGIPMDPTYVGKAFYGMKEWIKKRGITGKNILFIHTGGTPLWLDHMLEKGKEDENK